MSETNKKNNQISSTEVLNQETTRYQRKGYGLIFASILASCYFILSPIIINEYYPSIYEKYYPMINNDAIFFTAVTLIWHTLSYLIINLGFYIIYSLNLPFFERYKIHPEKPWPWQGDNKKWKELFWSCVFYTSFNNFIILPASYIPHIVKGAPPTSVKPDNLPNFLTFFLHIIFFMICEDFFFYWGHRLLHHDKLYPHIHK